MEDLALCRFQSVNNDVIDSHHEKIIGFFNVLLTATDQLDDETYEEIVHELINYAGYHFETEENHRIQRPRQILLPGMDLFRLNMDVPDL